MVGNEIYLREMELRPYTAAAAAAAAAVRRQREPQLVGWQQVRYKSSFMQSVLPEIPRCDMALPSPPMQIDRFPCKFDSYSIGINFGLPKVKPKKPANKLTEAKSGDLRQMKIKRPALESRPLFLHTALRHTRQKQPQTVSK